MWVFRKMHIKFYSRNACIRGCQRLRRIVSGSSIQLKLTNKFNVIFGGRTGKEISLLFEPEGVRLEVTGKAEFSQLFLPLSPIKENDFFIKGTAWSWWHGEVSSREGMLPRKYHTNLSRIQINDIQGHWKNMQWDHYWWHGSFQEKRAQEPDKP